MARHGSRLPKLTTSWSQVPNLAGICAKIRRRKGNDDIGSEKCKQNVVILSTVKNESVFKHLYLLNAYIGQLKVEQKVGKTTACRAP